MEWVAAVNRKDWVPKQRTRICNEHFATGVYSGDCLLEARFFFFFYKGLCQMQRLHTVAEC